MDPARASLTAFTQLSSRLNQVPRAAHSTPESAPPSSPSRASGPAPNPSPAPSRRRLAAGAGGTGWLAVAAAGGLPASGRSPGAAVPHANARGLARVRLDAARGAALPRAAVAAASVWG
jgi:hypothetical protein